MKKGVSWGASTVIEVPTEKLIRTKRFPDFSCAAVSLTNFHKLPISTVNMIKKRMKLINIQPRTIPSATSDILLLVDMNIENNNISKIVECYDVRDRCHMTTLSDEQMAYFTEDIDGDVNMPSGKIYCINKK